MGLVQNDFERFELISEDMNDEKVRNTNKEE